jgi:hypothetical protein
MTKLANIHPCETLLEEFPIPMEISQNRLARDIGVQPWHINEIVHGKRAVTAAAARADTDLPNLQARDEGRAKRGRLFQCPLE